MPLKDLLHRNMQESHFETKKLRYWHIWYMTVSHHVDEDEGYEKRCASERPRNHSSTARLHRWRERACLSSFYGV